MANAIIKYLFDKVNTSNPDGTFPVNFTNTQKIAGPGNIDFDDLCRNVFNITQLDHALDLGNSGKASLQFWRNNMWFFGPFGWIINDINKLDVPIPYRGSLNLWDVESNLL